MKKLIPLIENGFEVRDNIEGELIVYGIRFEGTNEYLILTKPHKKDKDGFRSIANNDNDYFEKRKQILCSILNDNKNKGYSITTGINAYERFIQLSENGIKFVRKVFFNSETPLRPSPPNKVADLLEKWFETEYQFVLQKQIAKSLKVTEKNKVQFRLLALEQMLERRQKEFDNKPNCSTEERFANTSFVQYLKRETEIANSTLETNSEQAFTVFNNDVNREVKYCSTFTELYHYAVAQGLDKDENRELNAVARENDKHLMDLQFSLWLNDKYQLEISEQNYLALCNFENYKAFFKGHLESENSQRIERENTLKKNRIEVGLESSELSNDTSHLKNYKEYTSILWLFQKKIEYNKYEIDEVLNGLVKDNSLLNIFGLANNSYNEIVLLTTTQNNNSERLLRVVDAELKSLADKFNFIKSKVKVLVDSQEYTEKDGSLFLKSLSEQETNFLYGYAALTKNFFEFYSKVMALKNDAEPQTTFEPLEFQKIKWLGEKEHFVELMMELIAKGFIENFTHIDLKDKVSLFFNTFDFSLSSKSPTTNTLENLYQNFKEEKRSAIMSKPITRRRFDKIKQNTSKNNGLA